jgi:hypothetical protein
LLASLSHWERDAVRKGVGASTFKSYNGTLRKKVIVHQE